MKTILLPNNLNVIFNDLSRRYFGDFHHVKIEISCTVSIDDVAFASSEDHAEAAARLGTVVTYTKVMEKMGVPTAELETTRKHLIDYFEKHTISYMSLPSFPARLVKAELARKRKTPAVISICRS